MTFAQRRNRLTTHFSERIPVVKRRLSVLHKFRTYVTLRHHRRLRKSWLRNSHSIRPIKWRTIDRYVQYFLICICLNVTISVMNWQLIRAAPNWVIRYKTLADHIKCLGWLGSRRFSLYLGGLGFKYGPGDRLTWRSVFTAFVSFFGLTLIQNDAIPLLPVDAASANEFSCVL